jgi:transposase
VICDNASCHTSLEVIQYLWKWEGRIEVHLLPSYSPDLNPIEPAWSKLKAGLRAVGARSKEALEAALGPALAAITAQDAHGWFRLAGYPAAD